MNQLRFRLLHIVRFGWRFVIGLFLGLQSYRHHCHYHHFGLLHCFRCLLDFGYLYCYRSWPYFRQKHIVRFDWRIVIGLFLGLQSYRHHCHYHLVVLRHYYQYYFGFVCLRCFQNYWYYHQMIRHCFGWRFVIGLFLGLQSYRHHCHYHHFGLLHCFQYYFGFVCLRCFQNYWYCHQIYATVLVGGL